MTPKQARFVDEYLIDLNASAAYLRAGYKTGNSNVCGSRLLANASIQAAIQSAQAKLADRTGITQDRVLRELSRVAFGNKRDLMTWGPGGVSLIDSATLTDDAAAMVAEVAETTSETGGSIRLKTHDKVKALELIGRHLGMFTDKVEVTGKDGAALSVTVYMPDNGRDDEPVSQRPAN